VRLWRIRLPLGPPIKKSFNGVRSGKYFFGGHDKPLINENSLGRAFRIFLQRHKLYNENSLHTLRHTFISYMIDSGTNIKKMQEIAGHNNIKTTLKYTHVVPSNEPAIRKLNYDKYIPQDD
jgi:site-specific recombinase XerD